MLYAFIAALVLALVLAVALYYQTKATNKQTADEQQLLDDYQRRVNEQQKLLDDYRTLEKNFDNIGQGYEQALQLYDQMEENSQKLQTTNEALQKRVEELQHRIDELQQANAQQAAGAQQKEAQTQRVLADVQTALAKSSDTALVTQVCRLLDINDLTPDLPPLPRTDNVLLSDIANRAVEASGVQKVQYLKFEMDVPADAAATMVLTQQLAATRILNHLLQNALKFTTDGTIRLAVAVDVEQMRVSYTVEDSGSGIAEVDKERIFEPYVKLNQYFDGDGIGLTVARNLARRLGGDVELASSDLTGSCFVLTLPM